MTKRALGAVFFLTCLVCAACQMRPPAAETTGGSASGAVNSAATLSPAKSSPSPTPERYAFHDPSVQKALATHFEKAPEDISAQDLAQCSDWLFLVVDDFIETLRDIPALFPRLRYLCIRYDQPVPQEDVDILANMSELRALKIHSDICPSFDFAKRLSYFEITYSEDAFVSDGNNLSSASMLGKSFIENRFEGKIKQYVKIVKDGRIFELVESDKVMNPETQLSHEECFETKVLILERAGGEYASKQVVEVTGRTGTATGGLILADVNFDGETDILVKQGHFGAQGLVTYSCYLAADSDYQTCESFSEIPNPAIDFQNEKILGCWRNWAASHSWAMYQSAGDSFVMTDLLTEEPLEEPYPDNIVWTWRVEQRKSGGMRETAFYSQAEQDPEELETIIYGEDGYWALSSEKWRTLNNLGSYVGYGIYGGDSINYAIDRIINQ